MSQDEPIDISNWLDTEAKNFTILTEYLASRGTRHDFAEKIAEMYINLWRKTQDLRALYNIIGKTPVSLFADELISKWYEVAIMGEKERIYTNDPDHLFRKVIDKLEESVEKYIKLNALLEEKLNGNNSIRSSRPEDIRPDGSSH